MIHCQKEGFLHLSEIALRPSLSTLPLDVRTIKSCVLCPTSGMVHYGNVALPCHPQIGQNELFLTIPQLDPEDRPHESPQIMAMAAVISWFVNHGNYRIL